MLEERRAINQPLDGRAFNGLQWLTETSSFLPAPSGSTSALVSLSAGAGGSVHGDGIGVYFDELFFGNSPSAWSQFLPSAAHVNGINGAFWTTDLVIANPGPDDATIYSSLTALVVAAGHTLDVDDVLGAAFGTGYVGYTSLVFTSTSPDVIVQSQTSTTLRSGGTVGQALAAVRSSDLIGAAPRTIAPVRDDGSFRTNLVLANATSAPLTAHVDLFDAAGVLIGSRDVPLEPLAAAQIGGVGWALAGGAVNPGRISVSTPTPGGLVAAYASVIDNVTNDPRTILPR